MTLSTRRRASTRPRTPIIGLVVAATVALAPGVAHAEPPTNDDFDTATAITALPFTTTQDTTLSTKAVDDPTDCYHWGSRSVWFRYTAPADGIVKATTSSTGYTPLIAVYTGERGALAQVPGGCTLDSAPVETFHVAAGVTYHLVLIEFYGGGQVGFDLTSVPPPPNDDLAAASAVGLPAKLTGDLARASAEPDEVEPSCERDADRSVWYRYTSERTRSVAVDDAWGTPGITVLRGGPGALTEVDCVVSGMATAAVFTAEAGVTYHLRVADRAERARAFELDLVNAPAIAPTAWPWPERPTTFDDVSFTTASGDRLGRPLVGGEVRFGDGTSAPITGEDLVHRYAADGEYRVEVTGWTADGRSGTGVRTIRVETHDVALSGLTVPTSARAGQTRAIGVAVRNNTGSPEDVEVELSRMSESGYHNRVGVIRQWVAGGAAVELPFIYTYTAADVAAGRVAFQVRARVNGSWEGDDNPVDNVLEAATTTVRAAANRVI
ncbi:hypothetical protein Q5530_34195 [Saccharothrix sp. BKS2]|uniref:hypothetical protein n=1 Tax=Saccharothrix sp. BKS2 TaxID=3064400 RepID=UPI0039EA2EB0